MLKHILAGLLLFNVYLSRAQWQQLSGPVGGTTHCIITQSGNLYAGTDIGVFVSSDNGVSWKAANNGLRIRINALVFVGTNLFAASSAIASTSGVYVSSDNGLTWSATPLTNVPITSLVCAGTNLFAGGLNDGVYISTNTGVTFQKVNNGLSNLMITSMAVIDTNIFAGTYGAGVFVTSNLGAYWKLTNNIVPDGFVRALSVDGKMLYTGCKNGAYSSLDYGVNWKKIYNSGISAFGINGSDIFINADDGLQRTSDTCKTFTKLNTGADLGYFRVTSFGFSGGNVLAGTIGSIVSNGNGILKSSDNGSTWAPANEGLTNCYILGMAVDGKKIYAGTGSGLFISGDAGVTWARSNTGLSDRLVMSFGFADSVIVVGTTGAAFRSVNGGGSWTVSPAIFSNGFHTIITRGNAMFGGSFGDGVYRSLNNGINWIPYNTGMQQANLNTLMNYGTYILAGTEAFSSSPTKLYITKDSGSVWTARDNGLSSSSSCMSLAIIGTDLFAGTTDGVYQSTDTGKTWIIRNSGLKTKTVQALITLDTTLIAATTNGIYVSVDRGAFWSAMSNGLTDKNIICLTRLGNNLFAGSEKSSVFKLDVGGFLTSVKQFHPEKCVRVMPNPFMRESSVTLSLKTNSQVQLILYNSLGQQVSVIENRNLATGNYSYSIGGGEKGIYFLKSIIDGVSSCEKLIQTE